MGAGENAKVAAANGSFDWVTKDTRSAKLIKERLNRNSPRHLRSGKNRIDDLFALFRLKRAGRVEKTAMRREAREGYVEDPALALGVT